MPLIVAILDTNVLVSALCLPASLPAELLRRWLAQEFVLVLSERILAELTDVLARPKIVRRFGMTNEKADTFADVLRDLALIVPAELIELEMAEDLVPDDPKDNHVLACAIAGNAGFIVSGDHHLKDIGQYQEIHILSPSQFHAVLTAV